MRIHTHADDLKLTNTVIAVGTFDGLHTGHQRIVERVRDEAAVRKAESVIVTFNPHPRFYFNPDNDSFKVLHTHLDKVGRFYHHHIDHLVVLPFNKELAGMTAEAFVQKYLVEKMDIKHLVLGYDNRLGKDQLNDDEAYAAIASRYGFTFERVGPLKAKGKAVSSSLIRDRLATGNIRDANGLLGYEYFVFGRVAFGNQIGKSLGFPTANIEIKDPHKMLPCNGVYIVRVDWNSYDYYGICNIGIRPTIHKSSFTFEVHLFDFHRDIYNDYLTVFFIERIRDEKRFNSLEELEQQIQRDKETAQAYLERNGIT